MPKKRTSALKRALEDPDTQVRAAAAEALDRIEALSDLPRLINQLTGPDRSQRIAAAYALGKVQSGKVFPPLLDALKSDDPDLRTVVASILGEKRHPKTLPHLVKALSDPEVAVVAELTKALGRFQDSRLPKVFGSLLGREEQIALAALDALGEQGRPEAEELLLKALEDQRPALRRQAAQALGKLPVAD